MTRLRTCLLTICVLASASTFAVLASQSSAATPKLYECQHPTKTGSEAFNLHNITVATACKEVIKLFRWEYSDGAVHIKQLYGCHGIGRPYLRLHTFDGYNLSFSSTSGFVMSKGASSFGVTGTDFPINCT